MKFNRKWFLTLLIACSCLSIPMLAKILVCPSCGTEYSEGDISCLNCGKDLPSGVEPRYRAPEPQAVPDVARPEVKEEDGPRIPKAVITGLLPQISELQKSAPWTAWSLARHARAISMLSDSDRPALYKQFSGIMADIEKNTLPGRIPCTTCKGNGKKYTQIKGLDGESKAVQVPGSCLSCKGAGAHGCWMTGEAIEDGMDAAERVTDRVFRKMRFIKKGGVFFPRAFEKTITPQQHANMMRAFGVRCKECHSLPKRGCDECNGVGKLPCPNDDCLAGMEICPSCDGTKREKVQIEGRSTVIRSCRTCSSRGVAACGDCRGNTFLICEDCRGKSTQACRKCEGNAAETCFLCDGQGTLGCDSCDETGTRGDKPCRSCVGSGHRICKECKGFGAEIPSSK